MGRRGRRAKLEPQFVDGRESVNALTQMYSVDGGVEMTSSKRAVEGAMRMWVPSGRCLVRHLVGWRDTVAGDGTRQPLVWEAGVAKADASKRP